MTANIKPETILVHHGEHERSADSRKFVPTSLPLHSSTTYLYREARDLDAAFEHGDSPYYIRHGSPNAEQLEGLMCALEGGRRAVATASGMSALHVAVLAAGTPRGETAPKVRHVLASNDLYGADHVLLRDFFAAQGTAVSYCDMTDLDAVQASVDALEPDVVLCESVSNPLLKIVDVQAVCDIAHAADARVIVDATMATPVLQNPISLGADLVVHSATKYLCGHADALGGVVIAKASLVGDTLVHYAHTLGLNLGAFEARMIVRGMKTLALRVRQQCANALHVATALAAHPKVRRVTYPGLQSHPRHALATRMLRNGYGGMLSLDLADASREACFRVMDALKLVLPATSLGDIYSLVTYPPLSSHRDLSPEQRAAQGIGDGLLRFSIGIEDADDILADIVQALG